jgi:hypothetical protein
LIACARKGLTLLASCPLRAHLMRRLRHDRYRSGFCSAASNVLDAGRSASSGRQWIAGLYSNVFGAERDLAHLIQLHFGLH